MSDFNGPSGKSLERIEADFGKNFYLFSEDSIIRNLKEKEQLLQNPDFLVFVKVSYAPNPYLIKIIKANKNFGLACSAMHELLIAEKAGFRESQVMFIYDSYDDNALLYANLRGFRLCVRSYENLLKAESLLSQLPYSLSLSQMQDAEIVKAFSYCEDKGVENIYINAENESLSETGRSLSKLALCKKLAPCHADTGVTVTLGKNIFVPYCSNLPEWSRDDAQSSCLFRHMELLEKADGSIVKIRRAETMDEYFSGIDFTALGSSCSH